MTADHAPNPDNGFRRVHVVGVGAGSPDHLTAQALSALEQVDVFLVPTGTDALGYLRDELLARIHHPHRVIPVDADIMPRNAEAYAAVIETIAADEVIGFLVWGDPTCYDNTVRLVSALSRTLPLSVRVVPGISPVQLLAVEHGIDLSGAGGPVHLTTGARLLQEWSAESATVVVSNDPTLACAELLDRAPDLTIHWGAYLGLPYQQLRSGRLADVVGELAGLRAFLRAEHGWIMDTYALSTIPKQPCGSA